MLGIKTFCKIWRNLPVDLSFTPQNILTLIGRLLVVLTQKVHIIIPHDRNFEKLQQFPMYVAMSNEDCMRW